MRRHDYYEQLKELARKKRVEYGLSTSGLGLREVRRIYKAEGIRIDLWRRRLRKVKAAYLVVDGEAHVLLNANIPLEPKLFALAHELKHHYADRLIASGRVPLGCMEYSNFNRVPEIEIGAELFAAEFLFPEEEFREWVRGLLGEQVRTPEEVVRLKRQCPAKVSYTYITKRLGRLGFCAEGTFVGYQFRKLEEKIFGEPIYKRVLRARARGARPTP